MPERTPRFRRRPHSSAAGRIAGGARSSRSRSTQLKPALRYEEINDPVGPFAGFEVGEDEGSVAAHPTSVAVHDFEAGTDQRGEVDLVDDEEVGTGDPRSPFARNLVAGRDVDHVDRQIGELGREGRGKVVAA